MSWLKNRVEAHSSNKKSGLVKVRIFHVQHVAIGIINRQLSRRLLSTPQCRDAPPLSNRSRGNTCEDVETDKNFVNNSVNFITP